MNHREVANEEANELYERYGQPLEAEHRGEFVAVTTDGRTLIAPSLEEAMTRARDLFGPGSFVFHIGPRVVGKWR
jgi:hypothetical protein